MTWQIVKLGECIDILSGFAFESEKFSTDKGIKLIRIRDVVRGYSDTYYDGSFDKKYLIKKDDILIGMDGEFNRARWASEDALLNQRVCKISAKDSVLNNDFLYHLLPKELKRIESITPFVTVKHLSVKTINEIQIKLPPLKEQQRIAAILDKAELVKRKRELAIEKLGLLAKNIFFAMFGNPNINNKNLKMQNLGEVLKVKSGNFLPANAMQSDGKHAVYGGNGINGYHDLYMFEDKKIVIGRVGAYCGCVHVTQPKSWVTDNALYIEEFSNELNFEYLAFALDIANLNKVSSQSGQPLISGARIYRVNILVPPLEDQAIFIKKLKQIDSHEIKNQKSSCLTKDMFNSLQSQAFSGQL